MKGPGPQPWSGQRLGRGLSLRSGTGQWVKVEPDFMAGSETKPVMAGTGPGPELEPELGLCLGAGSLCKSLS